MHGGMIFSGEKDGLKKRESHQQRREDQLAHLNVEVAAPSSPSPVISSEIEHAPVLSREDSFMSVSYMSNLPADTQKFLKFAGMLFFFPLDDSQQGGMGRHP